MSEIKRCGCRRTFAPDQRAPAATRASDHGYARPDHLTGKVGDEKLPDPL
jgi:hypothetical protein